MKFDRTFWPEGPWKEEPDRLEFEHAGFPCILNRGPSGAWCGYVGLPPGHPLFEKHYGDCDVSVHGGLTYSHHCQGEICHVTEDNDHRWWLGFDCMHAGDWAPEHNYALWKRLEKFEFLTEPSPAEGVYRDIAYARGETESLAKQLRGT